MSNATTNDIGHVRYVSTPNDFAIEVTGTHGSTRAWGVCKWVEPYVIWSAFVASDGETHWSCDDGHHDYSTAVATATSRAEWYSALVRGEL